MYVDFYGVLIDKQECQYKNETTKDSAVINLKLRKWGDKNAYEADGFVMDGKGNKRYLLEGKWDSYLNVINCQT